MALQVVLIFFWIVDCAVITSRNTRRLDSVFAQMFTVLSLYRVCIDPHMSRSSALAAPKPSSWVRMDMYRSQCCTRWYWEKTIKNLTWAVPLTIWTKTFIWWSVRQAGSTDLLQGHSPNRRCSRDTKRTSCERLNDQGMIAFIHLSLRHDLSR